MSSATQTERTDSAYGVVFDSTGASKSIQDSVRKLLPNIGAEESSEGAFWKCAISGEVKNLPSRIMVVGELARLHRMLRKVNSEILNACMSAASTHLVAYVRNAEDRDLAHRIDDMMRQLNHRLWVFPLKQPIAERIESTIEEVLEASRPESLMEVRYSELEKTLWLEFGDGLKGHLNWKALVLPKELETREVKVVRKGNHDDSVDVILDDESVYEIDAMVLRGKIDESFSAKLRADAEEAARGLGSRLRERRHSEGLTQRELMERSGIQQARISDIELGKHSPRMSTLRKYAKGLGMSVGELLSP